MSIWDQDMSEVDAEAANREGGVKVNKPGKYHVMIVDVEIDEDTHKKSEKGEAYEVTPHATLVMEVVQSVEGQSEEGSKLWHRINLCQKGGEPFDSKGMERLTKQFVRLGVMKVVDGVLYNLDGTRGKFPSKEQILGVKDTQVIVKVDHEPERKDPKTDQVYRESWRINWGNIWQLDDPIVADVPKNPDLAPLAMAASSAPAAAPEFGDDI